MRIICDTNIWYKIGDGTIKRNDIKNLTLCGTVSSAMELLNTPNVLDRVGYVKLACQAFREHCQEFISYTPADYVLKLAGFEMSHFDRETFIFRKFDEIIEAPISELAVNSRINRDKIVDKINRHRAAIDKTVDFINSQKPEINARIRNSPGGVKWYRRKTNEAGVMNVLKYMTDKHIKDEGICYEINWTTFPFEEIELFLAAWCKHFLEIEVSRQKFRRNDWADIMNMIYVGTDAQYWTLEDKWNRYTIESNLDSRLFSLST